MPLAIGLNSGSSFDGIDVVLIDIPLDSDGYPKRPVFKSGKSYAWPKVVAEKVIRSFENKLSVFELCRLNYEIGAVFAECIQNFMDEENITDSDVEVIGYDAQTIYQEPPVHEGLAAYQKDNQNILERWTSGIYACGLQIGEPAIVSAITNIITVNNYRPADHVLGGTGAPLMQYLDYVAFREIGPVLTLNIGGIANCHLAHKDRNKMYAFDTGPGNVMIDHAMNILYGLDYDKDGETARSGKIISAMLEELFQHEYFKRPIPRCAWRLDFGSSYANGMLEKYKMEKKEDIIATLTEFTALAISRSIKDNIPDLAGLSQIIASGGGTKNKFLLERLQKQFPAMDIVESDVYGIPSVFKEAIKFATLAYATINQFANNIPAACGASEFTVLGKVSYPPKAAKFKN